MIKKVRWKFIWLTVTAMTLCTAVIIISINLVNFYQRNHELFLIAEETSLNHGELPRFDDNNTGSNYDGSNNEINNDERVKDTIKIAAKQFQNRYFSVWIYEDGTTPDVSLKMMTDITEKEAVTLAKEAIATGETKGDIGDYKFSVYSEDDNTVIVTFLDVTSYRADIKSLAMISVTIGLISIIFVFFFVVLMSGKVVQPLIESDKKQKRFITDAGHELKTPLTVIATNMDILNMDLGENEWVENTQKQVTNLRKLVNHLVSLSRMEEDEIPMELQKFNFSNAVQDTAGSFTAVAMQEEKSYMIDVEPDIIISGNEGTIRQMVAILCDNAVKYAVGKGDIIISVKHKGKKSILEVSNLRDLSIDPKTMKNFFDRFYRADESRNKENGKTSYGLGLAIAKSIVEKNHGQISVQEREGGRIAFTVIF